MMPLTKPRCSRCGSYVWIGESKDHDPSGMYWLVLCNNQQCNNDREIWGTTRDDAVAKWREADATDTSKAQTTERAS